MGIPFLNRGATDYDSVALTNPPLLLRSPTATHQNEHEIRSGEKTPQNEKVLYFFAYFFKSLLVGDSV